MRHWHHASSSPSNYEMNKLLFFINYPVIRKWTRIAGNKINMQGVEV
jgi:hypothetical protein